MDSKHHCNGCPHWYVTKKKYPSGFYNITICGKYNKQLYYLAGEENRTPHPCDICSKRFSYAPYIPIKIKGECKDSQWNISRNARSVGGICLHTCIINTEILIRFGFAIVVILKILLEREHIPHKQLIREVEQVTERLTEKIMVSKDGEILGYRIKPFHERQATQKLAEYENAEEEGRLVVLPCKVGDTVYLIDDIDCVFERESIVTGIEIDEDGVTIMIQDESPISSSGYDIQDFGETIFLNRDVAEKALEEMNQENATN